jgi:uncharacterized membrane protein YcaP (DUF421 family)
MLVRGTLTYLALFLILRFVMKRQTSTIGIGDIPVVVVIADAAQNAFSREYRSLTEGLALVLIIVLWDFVLNYLSYGTNFSRNCSRRRRYCSSTTAP